MNNLIVVLGSEGMLGKSIVPLLKQHGYNLIRVSKNSKSEFNLDLTYRDNVTDLFNKVKPKVILNLTALTNIEYCEENIDLAYKTNTNIVENIIFWLKNNHTKSHLIQISTDHNYDGNGNSKENDIIINNIYGLTKYAGDIAASNLRSTVLRLNFLGKDHSNKKMSLSDWIYWSSIKKSKIIVFDNIYFSPLSYINIVNILDLVIQKKIIGIYNIGCRNGISKADFAFKFLNELGLSTENLIKGSYNQFEHGIKVKRPFDMRMCVKNIENALNIEMPSIEDVIKDVVCEYRN